MNSSYSTVAITTGDPDGIGFEVTAKALHQIGPQNKINFFLFRDFQQEKKQKKYFQLIDQKFTRLTFNTLNAALAFYIILKQTNSLDPLFLFDLELKTNAASWIIESTKLCKSKIFSSLVTAPISKTLIKDAGYNFIGHTGIFKSFYPKHNLFMGFVGKRFNVVLATDHVALADVEKTLTPQKLSAAVFASVLLKDLLGSSKPIALLGLNPHAGEKGVLGSFEKKYLASLHKKYKKVLTTPISPDAAFFQENWGKYSVFLSLYHDQGLIPFKMIHGQDSGVHITLGLPFIRTSVDHGTAKDIYNKHKANPNSMIEALELNLKLLKRSLT